MHDQGFLVDVAIVLGVAFPVLVIGRMLRVPELISYLVTGIAIGPHALKLIDDPKQVEAIAEVGVALILFFIGQHVPIARLRTLGRTTFVSESAQMAFTVAAVVLIGLAVKLDVRQSTFYGLLIALGSTAVVMPLSTIAFAVAVAAACGRALPRRSRAGRLSSCGCRRSPPARRGCTGARLHRAAA